MSPRIVEVRQNVLRKNDELARSLRMQFRAAGVFVVSLVSSPGAGKTELLQRTLTEMRVTRRVAALVGDLATDRDAQRLAQSGAPVRQITTGDGVSSGCTDGRERTPGVESRRMKLLSMWSAPQAMTSASTRVWS